MGETWFSRDLPVLRAIVELDEEPGRFWVDDQSLMERTGFDEATLQMSLKALAHENPPFADFGAETASGEIDLIRYVTGHARRTVGQWPAPKTNVDEQVAALLAAFDQAAEEAPDEASKGKIRAVAETFKGLPAQLAGAVSTAALLKLTGLA